MKTRLERLSVKRIEVLAKEAEHLVFKHHTDMGAVALRETPSSNLLELLGEIMELAEAINEL